MFDPKALLVIVMAGSMILFTILAIAQIVVDILIIRQGGKKNPDEVGQDDNGSKK